MVVMGKQQTLSCKVDHFGKAPRTLTGLDPALISGKAILGERWSGRKKKSNVGRIKVRPLSAQSSILVTVWILRCVRILISSPMRIAALKQRERSQSSVTKLKVSNRKSSSFNNMLMEIQSSSSSTSRPIRRSRTPLETGTDIQLAEHHQLLVHYSTISSNFHRSPKSVNRDHLAISQWNSCSKALTEPQLKGYRAGTPIHFPVTTKFYQTSPAILSPCQRLNA